MARRLQFTSSLYGRIALAMLPVLLLLGAIQFKVFSDATVSLAKETLQRVNVALASEVVTDFSPSIHENGLDLSEIEEQIAALSHRYPAMDFYLLNGEGSVILSSRSVAGGTAEVVDVQPIRRFLDPKNALAFPIFGPDPSNGDSDEVFSAASFRSGGEEYYLYIVLTSFSFRHAMSALSSGYTVRTAIVTLLLTTGIASISGLALFFLLTARLRRLAKAVKKIEGGEYDTPLPYKGNDEIAHLSGSVQAMAQKIVATLRETERIDSLRRRLIAQVAHDVRGPLTGVRGRLEALSASLAPDRPRAEASAHANRALEAIETAQSLIDDLFELSKLEAKDRPLQREHFSLLELAATVLQDISVAAARSDVSLHLEPGAADTDVFADALLMQRVIRNLVENAIKATSTGGSVRLLFQELPEGLEVRVIDTGRGMTEEEQKNIFLEFFTTDRVHGSGLGLIIIKKILEEHGSIPRVESVVGQGSIFSFVLPRQEAGNEMT